MTDVNGKDIYEGDIVKNAYTEEEYKRKFPDDYKGYGYNYNQNIEDEFIGECKFRDNGSWVIDIPEESDDGPLFTEIGYNGKLDLVEIIGNVYENEGLLKALIS